MHATSYLWTKCTYENKLKQWWSSIPPISTKQTITTHLNWTHWTHTQPPPTTYGDVEIPSPSLGQTQKCGGVIPVNVLFVM